MNGNKIETFESDMKFNTDQILGRLNSKFNSLYKWKENISHDESLILWKGTLGYKQHIS
jgi:late competence protein required for DNA uptake (superfamily II DNA/RNA helicase)